MAFSLLVGAATTAVMITMWGPTEQAWGVGIGGAVVGTVLAYLIIWPIALHREKAWMRALPYEFDTGRYLLALGKRRSAGRTRVELRVEFEEPLPEDAQPLVRDAGNGMSEHAKAKLEDGELVLKASIKTERRRKLGSSSSSGDTYPTHEVHRYVRFVLQEGVAALHARYAVRRVIVKLS